MDRHIDADGRDGTDNDPTVAGVVSALDRLTGGRLSCGTDGDNPWAVTKDSGIPGKAVTELPGLVCGPADKPVRRLAVAMSVTEHDIELANAIGVDVIVAHHPVADAASAGGVTLVDYLGLYDLAIIECHEAFHGLHPGIAHLHGHEPFHVDTGYDGLHGRVVMVGRPVDGIEVLGDIVDRLDQLLGRSLDRRVTAAEADARGLDHLNDSATAPGPRIHVGTRDTPVGAVVAHAFPHTGFGPSQLDRLTAEHPGLATLILSISGARPGTDLIRRAADAGLNVVVGSLHASEILENGLPLGYGLQALLPNVEVLVFRERVVALPLERAGGDVVADYGRRMAAEHLLPRAGVFDGQRATASPIKARAAANDHQLCQGGHPK